MSRLHEVALALNNARRDKRVAEKIIADLTPVYFELLDKEIGPGQVSFDISGMKYGRVMADKSTFDIYRFRAEHPEIALDVIQVEEKLTIDEDKLNEYLAEHPEDQQVVAEYVQTKQEPRWKPPVAAKES